MNAKTKTVARVLGGIAAGLLILMILLIAFASPIAKFVVEKYDVKWFGREVKLGWVIVNPLNGYVHISNLRLYEHNSDTVFFSAAGVTANFNMSKLLAKTYEIEDITINKPWGRVIQNHQSLNFDDMIEKFSSKDTTAVKSKSPVKFSILKIKIEDGEFHYVEQSIPVNYFIKQVNIESPGKRWDSDSMLVKFAVVSGPSSGKVKGNFSLNFDSLEYRLAVQVEKFDLKIMEQYLRDLANYGHFRANLDADVKATGNLKGRLAVTTSGFVAVNDFHFGKVEGDDYMSFEKVAINMTKVDPRNYHYDFDTIMLNKPFFKYERYDYLDNLQRMFGKGGKNYAAAKADSTKFNLIIVIADYVRDLAKNLLQSYYRANRVAVYDGDIRFNDYALRDKFAVAAKPLNIVTDTIDRNHERMNVKLTAGINPYGNLGVTLSLDPNDYNYFDMDYKLLKVPLSVFNPYVTTYTSFPLDKGTLEFRGDMHVDSGRINCYNHLLIIDPKVAKRLWKRDTKWIPVPLIMSFVREPGDAITIELPIKGDLNDPKFKFGPVILEVVKNIFIKPPSTAYLVHVKQVEKEVEKSLTVKWPMRQWEMTEDEDGFVKKIAEFLKKNGDARIFIYPFDYAAKEKEHILFNEAKRKYYCTEHGISNANLSEEDSIKVDKMSVKDDGFVAFLNKNIADTNMVFTIQNKCRTIISDALVDKRYAELLARREEDFMKQFRQAAVEDRVKFGKREEGVPYNGFSYYKIDYNGQYPENLRKAYREINELNENAPRKKFENERKRNGGILIESKEVKRKI